jgi:hypothetical protein
MRAVPELVFVNCCHLAARNIDQLLGPEAPASYDRVRFASGVAEQLIAIGVRCVIAAGWAVDDAAAGTFATTFYRSLLRGNRFINAVAEAREASYDPDNNTWAAYQCYGDPDWVFRRDGPDANAPTAASEDEFAGVASAAALSLALETIVVQTKFQGYAPAAQLERVRALEKRFTSRWGGNGAVAELFGTAYLTTRDVASAIRWYELAIAADDGAAPIKAAEQLANARVRLASETVAKAQHLRESSAAQLKAAGRGRRASDRKARAAAARSVAAAGRAFRASLGPARSSVKEAMSLLEKLVAVQPTVERESLCGSAYKHLALIAAAAGRTAEERQAIQAMKVHYQRAAVIARERQAANAFYPGLNYLAAELALNTGRRGWTGVDASIVEVTSKSLEGKNLADPDFWSVVGQTELQLYKALAGGGSLAGARDALERGFQDLHKRVAAPWMWASVYDNARFVLQKYTVRAAAREKKAAAALLERLAAFAKADITT